MWGLCRPSNRHPLPPQTPTSCPRPLCHLAKGKGSCLLQHAAPDLPPPHRSSCICWLITFSLGRGGALTQNHFMNSALDPKRGGDA